MSQFLQRYVQYRRVGFGTLGRGSLRLARGHGPGQARGGPARRQARLAVNRPPSPARPLRRDLIDGVDHRVEGEQVEAWRAL